MWCFSQRLFSAQAPHNAFDWDLREMTIQKMTS